MTQVLPLTTRPAWLALGAHYETIRGRHLRALFAGDATRGERLTTDAVGLYLDDSKNRVTDVESETEPTLGHDSSTNSMIRRYRKLRDSR
jgi:hypothetical protein